MNKDEMREKFCREHPDHPSIQANIVRRRKELEEGNFNWRLLDRKEREWKKRLSTQ